jgi:Adenylate and Guanylate cyclase catalytic domain
MSENRKIAAILVADVVGFGRLTAADEDRTLARLRTLHSDLIDPTVAVRKGRVVKRTGDGLLAEFRSVVDAVRCAIELQSGTAERNVGWPADRRIVFRIGVHLGDVVEESDGDLAARAGDRIAGAGSHCGDHRSRHADRFDAAEPGAAISQEIRQGEGGRHPARWGRVTERGDPSGGEREEVPHARTTSPRSASKQAPLGGHKQSSSTLDAAWACAGYESRKSAKDKQYQYAAEDDVSSCNIKSP